MAFQSGRVSFSLSCKLTVRPYREQLLLDMSSAVISSHARLYLPLVCTGYLQALERHSLEVIQLARLDSVEVRITAVSRKLAVCKAQRCYLCLLQVASTLVEQALQLQPLHLVKHLQQVQDLDLELQVSVKLAWHCSAL